MMTDSKASRQWPFRCWWANVSLVIVVVLLSIYLPSIAAQLLVKPGGKGQRIMRTPEVESSIREAAVLRDANVNTVSCDESFRNEWHCEIKLAGGRVARGSAVWHESGHNLGVNVELDGINIGKRRA